MKALAPNLLQRRFQDLMEIARARLPSAAPDWTDHNAHDPGITLIELLAWVAEAQLYSLARLRRDERAAYAALLGIVPRGTRGATGMIWPDRLDPHSPPKTFTRSVVIPGDAVINVTDAENPTFRPWHSLLWAPGQIVKLETREEQGGTADHTTANERGGLPFCPLGEGGGRRRVLAMTFQCRDPAGLLGSDRSSAKGALWPIGVLVALPTNGAAAAPTPAQAVCTPLTATLVTESNRIELRIASDGTQGLLTSGTLLLDLDDVTISPTKFTIELRAPGGLPRPPRVLRIEPYVIPIRQRRTICSEPHSATGTPDWSFQLDAPGLQFASGEEPVLVTSVETTGVKPWRRCDRLTEQGPNDNVYELDARTGELTFGNGINGRIPPAHCQVLVTYSVSDGEQGSIARNRKWKVAGFEGIFGVNPEAITGAAAASEWLDDRREARRRSRDDHALVSAEDIAAAAKALPLLDVARAWVPEPAAERPRTGAVTLVAMRQRVAGRESEPPAETRRWLETLRRRLAPQMPLGLRLVVEAPRYAEFSIQAVLEAHAGMNPGAIQQAVEKVLQQRFALVDAPTGMTLRPPGVPVTRRDVVAWVRATEGVKRIVQLQLLRADGQSIERVTVARGGLPRWDAARSTIQVQRSVTGSPR